MSSNGRRGQHAPGRRYHLVFKVTAIEDERRVFSKGGRRSVLEFAYQHAHRGQRAVFRVFADKALQCRWRGHRMAPPDADGKNLNVAGTRNTRPRTPRFIFKAGECESSERHCCFIQRVRTASPHSFPRSS